MITFLTISCPMFHFINKFRVTFCLLYIIYNTCSYLWGLKEEGHRLPYIFHKIPLLRIIFNVTKIHVLFLLTTLLCSTVLYFTRFFKLFFTFIALFKVFPLFVQIKPRFVIKENIYNTSQPTRFRFRRLFSLSLSWQRVPGTPYFITYYVLYVRDQYSDKNILYIDRD